MAQVHVHPRVRKKRPCLEDADILFAWGNYIASQRRKSPNCHQVVRIGVSRDGRVFELVAAEMDGDFLIYHAKTPPTKSILNELGLQGRIHDV